VLDAQPLMPAKKVGERFAKVGRRVVQQNDQRAAQMA